MKSLKLRKLLSLLYEETHGFHFRWHLAKLLMFPFPIYTGGRVRAQILRWVGFHIGHGTTIMGTPILTGEKHFQCKLTIDRYTYISFKCLFDLAAPIMIGRYVVLSPEVMLFTGTHRIGNAEKRAGLLQPLPVTIEDGVWLGARCIVLPGVTVGKGAVVGAGAVVTKNVPAHTLVAGVPAVFIRELPHEE